jgi:hypothetical protein
MTRKLRLLKVIVQPVFVIDDADSGLTEVVAEPVTVAAQEWMTYPSTGFSEAFEALRQQLDADP